MSVFKRWSLCSSGNVWLVQTPDSLTQLDTTFPKLSFKTCSCLRNAFCFTRIIYMLNTYISAQQTKCLLIIKSFKLWQNGKTFGIVEFTSTAFMWPDSILSPVPQTLNRGGIWCSKVHCVDVNCVTPWNCVSKSFVPINW